MQKISNIKWASTLLFLLLNNFLFSQVNQPNERLQGIWVSGKRGVLIKNDRFIILKKDSIWKPIQDVSSIYYFFDEPLANNENLFHTWVTYERKRNIIIDKEKNDSIAKVVQTIKMELLKNGKLKMTLSRVAVKSQSDPGEFFIKYDDPHFGNTEFVFKRLKK
jgi:hypothetical protein